MRNTSASCFENSEEEALHLFCKQLLRCRIFRGFYKQRSFIDDVNNYRDQIIINRTENDLRVILEDIERRLRQYYATRPTRKWIGITSNCLWVELEELAFDEYWFSIKSLKLRNNEVILKLKAIRPIDLERASTSNMMTSEESPKIPECITSEDFIRIIKNWGTRVKLTTYTFMSEDLSKENFAAFVRFIILFIISMVSFSVSFLRVFGTFTIYFLSELRKLIVVLTPIILRLIDVSCMIIGGLYILLAMIWRDIRKGGGAVPLQQLNPPRAITYDQPIYQRLKYEQTSRRKQQL